MITPKAVIEVPRPCAEIIERTRDRVIASILAKDDPPKDART